jgi:hypothetical protein
MTLIDRQILFPKKEDAFSALNPPSYQNMKSLGKIQKSFINQVPNQNGRTQHSYWLNISFSKPFCLLRALHTPILLSASNFD